eukprot:scaffold6550_cov74-Cyclotella_meneghiniana.AAC.8
MSSDQVLWARSYHLSPLIKTQNHLSPRASPHPSTINPPQAVHTSSYQPAISHQQHLHRSTPIQSAHTNIIFMSLKMEPSSSDDNNTQTKLRITLRLAPGVDNNKSSLEIPADPIAVPCNIRKRGLSAVVNHLLGRQVVQHDTEDDSNDDEDESSPPAIPFDFLLSSKLLRLPLETAVRKEGISTEHAIELLYFPARVPPVKEGEGENVPDWITSMDYCSTSSVGGDGDNKGMLFTGCADGVVRSFSCDNSGDIQPRSSVTAHTGQIKCLSTAKFVESIVIATGSMDQTLVTHLYNNSDDDNKSSSLDLHAVYSGGHGSSISSVTMCNTGSEIVMASGDWDGGLVVWKVPGEGNDNSNNNNEEQRESIKKRQRGNKNNSIIPTQSKSTIQEIKPASSSKAHSSNVSGLAFGYNSPNTILTSSWDHSLKVHDIERMDCVLATNGSRVITSLSRCSTSNIVGTGCADNMVRLWDMRVGPGQGVGSMGQIADKTLRQR